MDANEHAERVEHRAEQLACHLRAKNNHAALQSCIAARATIDNIARELATAPITPMELAVADLATILERKRKRGAK